MGFSILVVDDDSSILGLFEELLRGMEYTIETAGGGRDALLKLKEKSYDLVITDLMMPDVSGMEVLKEVSRNHKKTRSIAITAFGSEKNLFDCMNLDCFGYVDKPFECDYMKELIRTALSER